ncbi:hypothetical protein PAPYR_1726 [Paratrimastix pyriformis]|uniref:IPT/TIG domain-containing protein n=1 Tax=Paratrimastix pyriformis TaxID=342808 RepID=A0ABQ8USX1_9EUKA|nr:hypothetical protein PAPYR_1726 [Paratrimastix pyriformis]
MSVCVTVFTVRLYFGGRVPQFGTVLTTPQRTPLLLASGLPAGQTVTQVCAMKDATVLLLDNGDLYGTGSNANGRLGLGSSVSSATGYTKIALPAGRTATTITCSYWNLAVILDDGSLATCGVGASGLLGDGTTADRFTLETVALPGTGRRAASLQMSFDTFFVRSTDGIISGTGSNIKSQFGLGYTSSSSNPITVLTDMPIPDGATVAWFTCATVTTLVYTTDGRLLAVGQGGPQLFATSLSDRLVLTESDLLTPQLGRLKGAATTGTSGSLAWGLAAPTLGGGGVSPVTTFAGRSVTLTLTGTHFRPEATVVTCTTNPALQPGSHDVVVTNTDIGLSATLAGGFTVSCFGVSSLSATVGRPGDVITVTGCGFTATCKVQLGTGGSLLATTFLSATSLRFVVPAQPSAATVTYTVFVTETVTGIQALSSTGAALFSYARLSHPLQDIAHSKRDLEIGWPPPS